MNLDFNVKKDNNIVVINDNPIISEYKNKYKPEELTDDGIPTIETQLREIKLDEEKQTTKLNEEQFYKREMIQRVKCLSLNKMNRDIFTNTNDLKPSDKKRLQEIMYTYNDIDHEQIIKEFNDLVCEDYLDNPKYDYSKAPIYHI